APHILRSIREIRKQDGVAILAAQEAAAIIEHPMGKDLLKSIATYVLYPAPTAEREHYVKGLGLTDAEYEWLLRLHNRQVLVKRTRTGECVIFDLQLNPLGRVLKVFVASTRAVKKLEQLRRCRTAWQEALLES